MVIADAIGHAIDPPLLLFLSYQQVEELEVILVGIQDSLADFADLVVQDKVHEVDQKVHEALDEKEHQDHQKKVNFGGDGELVSSPPSFSGVISGSRRPESSFQNTTILGLCSESLFSGLFNCLSQYQRGGRGWFWPSCVSSTRRRSSQTWTVPALVGMSSSVTANRTMSVSPSAEVVLSTT